MKVPDPCFVAATDRFSPTTPRPFAEDGVEGRSPSQIGDIEVPRGHGERGLTITELAVALMIISILSVIGIGILNGRIEKAWLARCHCELRSIQSTV